MAPCEQEREEVMLNKSPATKSKTSAKSKPANKAKKVAKSASKASWSTDDVYTLLKAVNEITLKRIEDRMNEIARISAQKETNIYNAATTAGVDINYCRSTVLPRMEASLNAIKDKVHA
jgi:hypothetical protein